MKVLNSKSGMTLVEMVLAILILGIGSIMLTECFSSAARMTNRATLYRNASVAASSTLELEEEYGSNDPEVNISYNTKDPGVPIVIKYKENENGPEKNFELEGNYGEANDSGTGLTYREFYPDNFSFNVIADPVTSNQYYK